MNKLSSHNFGNMLYNAVASATIGGMVSVLTGGKFKNGAVSGAFSRMLNDMAHSGGMGWVTYKGQRMYVHLETFYKNVGDDYLAGEAGVSMADYIETTGDDIRNLGSSVLSISSIPVGMLAPPMGGYMALGAYFLNPSWSNFIGASLGPLGKGAGMVDEVLYYGAPVLKPTINNVEKINDTYTIGCNTVVSCEQ